MNLKKKKTQMILLIYILTVLSSFALFSAELLDAKTIVPNDNVLFKPKNPVIDNLKTSYAANLTGNPIYIDDSDPNYNWSKTAEDNVWLDDSADGTLGNPYIIENIVINNLGSQNSSVIIKNSNVVFNIKNCYFYNTNTWGSNEYNSNGIYLYNVENGIINNNNLLECATGIRLDYSQHNSISSNYISYNDVRGIYLDHSSNNDFYNNTVSNNKRGFDLSSSSANEIDENIILNNFRYEDDAGINIWDSHSNNITDNTISFHYIAVDMGYSDSNLFSGNLIMNNGMGINIEYESNNIIFTGNSIFNNGIILDWIYISSQPKGVGIYCTSGDNLIIDNNDIYNNTACGIECRNGNNFIVTNNEIYDNFGSGINFRNLSGFNITNNKFWSNLLDDIYLKDTPSFKLTNNTMTGSGLFLDNAYSTLSGVEIDISNTVNGKPIYFFKDQSLLNSGDFPNAGQIYLYGCSFTTITNLNLVNATTGITLTNCINTTLSFIESSFHSRWGIGLFHCLNNDLSSLNVFENGFSFGLTETDFLSGIILVNCSTNIITGNLLSSNHIGLSLKGGNNSYIYNNTANDAGFKISPFLSIIHNLIFIYNIAYDGGIAIDSINNSIIAHNIASNGIGMSISDTKDCEIYENIANNNDHCGIGLENGRDTEFYNNTAINNYKAGDSLYDEPTGTGYVILNCESVDFYNNYAFKNYIGFLISESRDCEIKDNVLNQNGDRNQEGFIFIGPAGPGYSNYGLILDTCQFIEVFKNSINNNYIIMSNSHNNSLILNDIIWGGFILQNCNQNIILGNSIYRGERGVDLKDSSYNQILNNTITSMQCFREYGTCIGNIFENNYCKEELPYFFFREIMSIIGIAGVLGLNIPLYLKKRKNR